MPRSWMQGPVVDPFVQLDASVAVPLGVEAEVTVNWDGANRFEEPTVWPPGEFSFVNVAVIVDVPLATCAERR